MPDADIISARQRSQPRMRRPTILVVVSITAWALGPSMSGGHGVRNGGALAAQAAASTPTVDKILDKYVEAIGGKAALEKVTTRMMKGTLELPATGDAGSIVPGSIEVYAKAPNKRLSTVVIPGSGTDQRGYNGSAGWYVDPDEGPKDLSGPDLDAIKAEAPF